MVGLQIFIKWSSLPLETHKKGGNDKPVPGPLAVSTICYGGHSEHMFGWVSSRVEHQIYSKWSSLPLVTMGEITSQSCTWAPGCQCYVLLRTLKTHDWVGMQWPTRRTCGFLFKARGDLAEFCTWTPCCQFYLRWKTLGTPGWVRIQWKLSSSNIFLLFLLQHSRLYFFQGSHLVWCLCNQWSFKIAYYCYIFAHYHPTNIIWNVAKNSELR